MPLGSFDRTDNLTRLGVGTFDVLVVGGGVTGAGVALDASARGLRTALVERDDFASGTSTAGCATSRTATSASCTRPSTSASACCTTPPTW